MWVTFEYVLEFITLYVSAFALGGMFYYMADQIFPDRTAGITFMNSFDGYVLRGYIAALIVAFPIFAWLFIKLRKELRAHPGVAGIPSRKILFYFTLVVTFVILISQVIGIVYSFLSGGVTGQAVSHFVITVVIAGSIFSYLLREVKGDRQMS